MSVNRRLAILGGLATSVSPIFASSATVTRDESIYLGALTTWHDLGSKSIRSSIAAMESNPDQEEVIIVLSGSQALLGEIVQDMGEFKTERLGDYEESHDLLASALFDSAMAFVTFANWLNGGDHEDLDRSELLSESAYNYFQGFYESLPVNLPNRSAVVLD